MDYIKELRETKFSKGFSCPHCHSQYVIRHGTYNSRQRYKCKDCSKTFSDLTNTPLKRTHYPNKWIPFIDCMLKGLSLRESADIVGVTWVTLFYWRHKLLTALSQIEVESFNGILEADETYFLRSEKGKKHIIGRKPRKRGGVSKYRGISHEQVCVLVARDRSKQTLSKVSCMGRIDKKKIDDLLGSRVSSSNILCTDAWRSYMTFAKEKGIEHYRINSTSKEYTKKGIYHIQNINNYHQRLKKWIDRFDGVASKYLDNYLAWFRFLDSKSFEETTSSLKGMLITACLYDVHETNKSLRLKEFKI